MWRSRRVSWCGWERSGRDEWEEDVDEGEGGGLEAGRVVSYCAGSAWTRLRGGGRGQGRAGAGEGYGGISRLTSTIIIRHWQSKTRSLAHSNSHPFPLVPNSGHS